MMTDKATVEMESPVAGKVVELAGEVGDQIPIGSVLVVIETEGEVAAGAAAEMPMADGAERTDCGAGRSGADDGGRRRRRNAVRPSGAKRSPKRRLSTPAARNALSRLAQANGAGRPKSSPPPPSASAPAISASISPK